MAKIASLAVEICNEFKNLKDFGFKDQICRAVVSISNNIAEGFDRSSNADFARFLYISMGSCSELRSMLHLSHNLGYIQSKNKDILIFKATEISKIIKGLIKSLQK